MCLHETIQLSQDGERIIVCGDCGREFAKIARDQSETFMPILAPNEAVIILPDAGAEMGLVVNFRDGSFDAMPTYPCRVCEWAMSCHLEGEQCHT